MVKKLTVRQRAMRCTDLTSLDLYKRDSWYVPYKSNSHESALEIINIPQSYVEPDDFLSVD